MTKAINLIYLALFGSILMWLASCRTLERTQETESQTTEQTDSTAEKQVQSEVTLSEIREKLEQVEKQTEAFYEKVTFSPPDSTGKQYILDKTTAGSKTSESRYTQELVRLQMEATNIQAMITRLRTDIASYEQQNLTQEWKYNSLWVTILVALILAQISLLIIFIYLRQKRP